MPIIILCGISSGTITPKEAVAVSVVYAIFVEMVIYRNFSIKNLIENTEQSATATCVIFILLAMGGLILFYIILAQITTQIVDFLTAIDAGPIQFLLAINVCFFIAGMFIDPSSALFILVPPLFPVATALGVDPIHFGLIVTLNISLGMITPPFSLGIFVASSKLNKPVLSIIRGVWLFIFVNILVLLVVAYVPQISLFILKLIFV